MSPLDLASLGYDSRRLWWIPVLTVTLGLGIHYWVRDNQPVVYGSEARLIAAAAISADETPSWNTQNQTFLETQASILQSEEVAQAARALLVKSGSHFSNPSVKLESISVPRTNILVLRAVGSDPLYAQSYLQACINAYFAIRDEIRLRRTADAEKPASQELNSARQMLEQAATALQGFQRQFSALSLQEDITATTAYLDTLHRRIADLRLQLSAVRTGSTEAKQAGAAIPVGESDPTQVGNVGVNLDTGNSPNQRLADTQQDLASSEAERQRLATNLRPAHPKIKDLDRRIEADRQTISTLQAQASDQHQDEVTSITREMEALARDIDEKQSHLLKINSELTEYQDLRANFETRRANYDKLIANVQNAKTTQSTQAEPMIVLASPSVGSIVPTNRLLTLIIDGLLGLAIGIAIVLIWVKLLPRFQTIAAVKRVLGLPAYGKIVRDRWMADSRTVLDCNRAHLNFAESFRNLRSSLLDRPEGSGDRRCIAVASAVPREGRSTIAVNLSIVLAAANARTLLIDGDFRRGRLHQMLLTEPSCGLSDVITGEGSLTEAIHATSMRNLSLLSCGSRVANLSERLVRYPLDALFRDLKARFDYIIVDTPPVLVSMDAVTLAARADAAMFVVRLGYSRPRYSLCAVEELTERDIRVSSAVINCVRANQIAQSHYRFYDRLETQSFLDWVRGTKQLADRP